MSEGGAPRPAWEGRSGARRRSRKGRAARAILWTSLALGSGHAGLARGAELQGAPCREWVGSGRGAWTAPLADPRELSPKVYALGLAGFEPLRPGYDSRSKSLWAVDASIATHRPVMTWRPLCQTPSSGRSWPGLVEISVMGGLRTLLPTVDELRLGLLSTDTMYGMSLVASWGWLDPWPFNRLDVAVQWRNEAVYLADGSAADDTSPTWVEPFPDLPVISVNANPLVASLTLFREGWGVEQHGLAMVSLGVSGLLCKAYGSYTAGDAGVGARDALWGACRRPDFEQTDWRYLPAGYGWQWEPHLSFEVGLPRALHLPGLIREQEERLSLGKKVRLGETPQAPFLSFDLRRRVVYDVGYIEHNLEHPDEPVQRPPERLDRGLSVTAMAGLWRLDRDFRQRGVVTPYLYLTAGVPHYGLLRSDPQTLTLGVGVTTN